MYVAIFQSKEPFSCFGFLDFQVRQGHWYLPFRLFHLKRLRYKFLITVAFVEVLPQ